MEPTTIAKPSSRVGPVIKISPAPTPKHAVWNKTNTCTMNIGDVRRLIFRGPRTNSHLIATSAYSLQNVASARVLQLLERWRRVAESSRDARAHRRMLEHADRLSQGPRFCGEGQASD